MCLIPFCWWRRSQRRSPNTPSRDNGIVVGRDINPETPRTAQNIADSFDRLAALTQGKRLPGLWDARAVPEFSLNLWLVFVTRIEEVAAALAILVNTEAESAFGAFPAAMDSMLIPVRLFREEDKAIDWLGQFTGQGEHPIRR